MLFYLFIQGLQKPAISTLRSTRIQFYALIVTFTAFWFIGIPLALFLTRVHDWGIRGLWLGMNCAAIVTCSFFHFLVYRIDWNRVISKALKRLNKEEVSSDDDTELQHDMPSPGRLEMDRLTAVV